MESGPNGFLWRGRSYGMEHQFCSPALDATNHLMRPAFSRGTLTVPEKSSLVNRACAAVPDLQEDPAVRSQWFAIEST